MKKVVIEELKGIVGEERMSTKTADLYVYGFDASIHHKTPDGVVYFKVANGRRRPKMPAFKEELKPEQMWAVVAYVQTLRKK